MLHQAASYLCFFGSFTGQSLLCGSQLAIAVATPVAVERALKSRRPYTLQAAIAAVHAEAESAAATGDRLLHFTTNWYEFSLP